jgi:hypothetical protein
LSIRNFFILEDEVESEVLTVDNVNEWLNSLHVVPTSPTTVDVDISEEGFKEYDCYKIEYTTDDQLNKWKQVRYQFCLKMRKNFFLRCRILLVMIHI